MSGVAVYIDPEHEISTQHDARNIGLRVSPITVLWGPPEALRKLRNTIDHALDEQREKARQAGIQGLVEKVL